ncbi:MAG: tRNA preQ1(34) S-adenosylmethionine ribosyltransferase-isomerase QueA, partial [Caldilineaceae bacterium]|nr:tRNA preQ1(34) S-adenosylmethionine ribosyltransferase-isomerase QueA [Caldilineaceae bacterium]
MKTDLFDYNLPPSLIAQQPVEPRDHSRLLVLDRRTGRIEHRHFHEIGEYLNAGDLLVANDSRVIPARLHGHKTSGGAVEIFLLNQIDDDGQEWECLTRGRNLREETVIYLDAESGRGDEATNAEDDLTSAPITNHQSPITGPQAVIQTVLPNGNRVVRFSEPIHPYLDELGEIPLPPYITEYSGDRERYQTIYSRPEGSVAAPTAGLHFTPDLLIDLRRQGVGWDTVTLHVGLDTFRPVTSDQIEDHEIHTEVAQISSATARQINDVTLQGGRVIAVGTTSVRTLEWGSTGAQGLDPYDTDACPWKRVAAFSGPVNLYIRPGYRFRAVDTLITNFHLPKSSLLMLVASFIAQAHPDDVDAGRRILLDAYEVAKQAGYRFFSFGDAM